MFLLTTPSEELMVERSDARNTHNRPPMYTPQLYFTQFRYVGISEKWVVRCSLTYNYIVARWIKLDNLPPSLCIIQNNDNSMIIQFDSIQSIKV